MKKFKNLLFYILTIVIFGALMYYVAQEGKMLKPLINVPNSESLSVFDFSSFTNILLENLRNPLAILILQIATIMMAARFFGYLFNKINQPMVIGEIIAGIFLGPSFIGYYYPDIFSFLFPINSLGNLQFVSQIGLILFMFIIGMELDLRDIKKKAQDAILISHASIIFPFALGFILASFLYERFAPHNIDFLSFALFLGISMSITAFPVLARIVQERQLSKTKIGALVITCAAIDDITAWCILAVVIAIVKAGSIGSSLFTIVFAFSYVAFMFKIGKPFLKRIGDIYTEHETLSKSIVAVFFIILFISAYLTEIIGIHALFGAFIAGVIMPDNKNFRTIFIEKIEDLALVIFLPLFFVFAGLKTQIGLLNDLNLWFICFIIILTAIAGKYLGSMFACRFVGESWKNSLTIGALMNTRGLMELIVLTIGLELGVLNPEIFTMMVLMALVTTFMTGPALNLINRIFSKEENDLTTDLMGNNIFRILIAFGNPLRGQNIFKIAYNLISSKPDYSVVSALHLTPISENNRYISEEYEDNSFYPIKTEADKVKIPLRLIIKPSQNITKDICAYANSGEYDFLMIGIGNSVIKGTFVGKLIYIFSIIISPIHLIRIITGKAKFTFNSAFDSRTWAIIKNSQIPVAVFIDQQKMEYKNIFVNISSQNEIHLLSYIYKIFENSYAKFIVQLSSNVKDINSEWYTKLEKLNSPMEERLKLISGETVDIDLLETSDLLIVGLNTWKAAIESSKSWTNNAPSVLVIKK